MDNYFEIVFLNEAFEFLRSLDKKHSNKILYNIRKAQQKHDPELFKNSLTTFGNSEPYIKVYSTDF